MGRDPSGSAGTGQAKMGSRAERGRGGSCSALRLRQGGVGVAARCIPASPRLPLLRCLRLVKHPPAQTTQATPLTPGSFHHVAEPVYKARRRGQERGPLARPPPEPSAPARVISHIRGSPAVLYFPLRETPLEIAPQRR